MSKFLDDERKANLERLPLLESALKDAQAARGFPLAPRMKCLRRLVELMSYAKTFAGLGDVEAALPKPQFPVQTGDDCKNAATVSEAVQKRYGKAIRAYTEDGWGGVFWKINGAYREFRKGFEEGLTAVDRMDDEARQIDNELAKLFNSHARLQSSVRVYRGISPRDADEFEKSSEHVEYAYCSTSTSFSVAFDYARKKGGYDEDYSLNGAVLIVDLPADFPAISLETKSAKPYEKEVLLEKKCTFTVEGITIAKTALGRYRMIHLVGELA